MSTEVTERKKKLRDDFIESRGYWNPFWDSLLDADEDFFEAYTNFSSVPWRSGVLDPKIKEFVYIAVDAAATHLFVPGIRQHIKQAIAHGASAEEIMEVLELTSHARHPRVQHRRADPRRGARGAGHADLAGARPSAVKRSRPTSRRSAATGTSSGTRSCCSTPTSSSPTSTSRRCRG